MSILAGRGVGVEQPRPQCDDRLVTSPARWQLVVPVKGGTAAKSRLHTPPGVDRRSLALALATDCLAAVTRALPPARVVVVTSAPESRQLAVGLGALVVADPGAGLDAAVLAGLGGAQASEPGTGLAVLLGDLPCLRPDDLLTALAAAAAHPLAVVPDAEGTGTVLLTARAGSDLVPSFGTGSALRHVRAGHVRLDLDLPRLRCDVDDDASLRRALDLGVGPATRSALAVAS